MYSCNHNKSIEDVVKNKSAVLRCLVFTRVAVADQKDLERLMQAIRKSKPRERLLFTLLTETGLWM